MYRVVTKYLCAAAVAGAMMAPTMAVAASNGPMGSTGAGSVDISVTVPDLVKISYLQDVTFIAADLATLPASKPQNICVYSNTGGYKVTAATGGASFSLTGAGGNIGYSVEWADSSGATTGDSLGHGVLSTGYATGAVTANCTGGSANNASLIIKISESDIGAAAAGTYTGTLNLTISPN